MAKVLTVNEMIYKTLTTKETKVPKYKAVLEALGFELVKDHGWSHYDYWGIKMKEDNRILVISQGYDKIKRLYKTAQAVKSKDITKVDFVNLINIDRNATRWYNRRLPDTNIQQYKRAKETYETDLSICEDHKKRIKKAEDELEAEKKRLSDWEKYTERDKVILDGVVARIKRKGTI